MRNLLKGKTLSLVTSGMILSSTMAFGANTIEEAFKEGTVSGGLAAYTTYSDNKGVDDSAFSTGAVSLGFETASLNGFSAKAGFIGVHLFDEKYKDDASEDIASKALMTEASISYTHDLASLTIGRQEIDLEWMGDFHEAAVASITAIPDTTMVLGYTQKIAVAGVDEISERFEKVNENKGAYVLDIKYAGLDGLEFNPYAYSAPDLADWYGLKTTFEADNFGLIAHYALTNEDLQADDGSIAHLELNGNLENLTVAVGYIKTDKDGGTGSIAKFGDNISPFEDGNYVYETDAKTAYASIGYTIADIELGALYGETKYNNDFKEKELNLTVGYSFTESLAASVLYADISADSKDTDTHDYNKVLASVEYTF